MAENGKAWVEHAEIEAERVAGGHEKIEGGTKAEGLRLAVLPISEKQHKETTDHLLEVTGYSAEREQG